MPEPQQGFAIGVDLGTSNTVAVLRWSDGRSRPLLVDGAPIMTSGVYADESGQLYVGRDAQRLAGLDPSRFEPNPKRRIDEPGVLLGDREVSTVDLLAALLGAVARAAVEAVGFLPPAVLTYPASWGGRRRDILAAGAARAGWPPVRMLPEPVAAARYFADVLRRPIPVGASLAVFDFGGGTLDVAVVRNENGQFAVLGSGGIENLGGLDIDAALVEHLGGVLAGTVPDVWNALSNPENTIQRRDRRLFWEDVRGAKEMLSRTTVAPVATPGRDQAIHLTREELERVAEPLLRRAVWETGAVIERCGLRPDQLAGLFLVGGSSRLPLAARLLHAELGVAPTVLEQPELPVAEGALAELGTPSVPTAGPARQTPQTARDPRVGVAPWPSLTATSGTAAVEESRVVGATNVATPGYVPGPDDTRQPAAPARRSWRGGGAKRGATYRVVTTLAALILAAGGIAFGFARFAGHAPDATASTAATTSPLPNPATPQPHRPASPAQPGPLTTAYLRGGATLTAGRFDKAVDLDGVDDYVEVPYAESLALGSRDFTVMAWIRYGASTTEQAILWGYGQNESPQFWLRAEPSSRRIRGLITTPSGTAAVASTQAYNDNNWHHVALRRAGGQLTLWVDGTQVDSDAAPAGSVSPDGPFRLYAGQRLDGAHHFKGALDEVRMYGRSLSTAELSRIWSDNATDVSGALLRLLFTS